MSLGVSHALFARGYVPRDPTETALYGLVRDQLATFRAVTAEQGGAPDFVLEGFARFLRCGVLAHGFARFACASCRHEHLVSLSCKTRGLCPSCGGRRMAVLTQHIVDAVLPHVATRQWVLSVPFALRYRLAYDQTLCTAVHRILAAAVARRLRALARRAGVRDAQTGSVTFVQRYGSGLNLNLHYHLIGLDGWFAHDARGELAFTRAPTPTDRDVEQLILRVHAQTMRLLARRGLLEADSPDPLAEQTPPLAACYEGAVTQRVGLGPARGRPVIKLRTSLVQHLEEAAQRVERGARLCAQLDGFDLHGRVGLGPADRKRLADLVRYCARPPLAHDRLTREPHGHYLLRLKTRWRDGTTHLRFEPIELMERLAAQIPKPRINQVLYAGVLAPHARLRAQAVTYARPAPLPTLPATQTQTRAERETWAALMRTTFDLDVLTCPRCGGRMRHLATILDAREAQRILAHLRLPARAPPLATVSTPPPFWPRSPSDEG
jgi:Putative transposase/Transposase zinc-binding domain